MKVTRVEQQFIKKTHQLYELVDRYCFYSKNVYNQANYLVRQAFIKDKNSINCKWSSENNARYGLLQRMWITGSTENYSIGR